jgi:hypothetical protein
MGIVNADLNDEVWRHHGGDVTFIFASLLPRALWRADEHGTRVSRRRYRPIHEMRMTMVNKVKAITTAAYPLEGRPGRWLAATAVALALLATPQFAHAQGVVGGMERGAAQGSYDGSRVAGPVGGAVGGAVGAGVGGAVGAVDGILGIPGPRCRGYYNRYGHWRCYRY